MATVSASPSVAELTTDVNSTVEHLRGLGQLVKKSSGAGELALEELGSVDEVITALRELDEKRQKAHELLETETITASVLRHKLAIFPHRLKAEANTALESARESNTAQIQSLQSKLAEIGDRAAQAEKKKEVLELHNDVLEPELGKIRRQHKELVKEVNASMSKKAQMQIALNETEDKLSTTTNQIESLGAGMLRLQEEMKRCREEFESEKESLASLLEDTKENCKKQQEENIKLNKELESLEGGAVEARLHAEERQRALRDTEADIERLLVLKKELREKLKNGAVRTVELEKIGNDTTKKTEQMREDYTTRKKEMLEKTSQYKKEVELASAETKRLNDIQRGLRRELKQAQDAKDSQSLSLIDMQESVGKSKRALLFQSEEGARLEAESRELEFKMVQLVETHQVNVQLLRDQIGELKDKLSMEKDARETVEESYGNLQCQIKAQRDEHTSTMAVLTEKITEAQRLHQDMSDKISELQQGIGEKEESITLLRQQLRGVQSKLHSTKISLERTISTLEQNIADLTEESSDRGETLQEMEPVCKSLENDQEEKSGDYETRKKELIALKNQRASLEETTQRLSEQLEKMHLPQDKLRMDTLRCRAYTRQCLRQQEREVADVEQRVLDANQQLTAVRRENHRIEEACHQLERESHRLRSLIDSGEEMEAQLDNELKKCREILRQQWRENDELEKTSSERDRVVLGDIRTLRESSEERLQLISTIHSQFDQELHSFSTFLNTAATV